MDWSSPAIRGFFGVLMAYPVMLIYRKWVRTKPLQWHHVYFAATGMCGSYFAFGSDGPLHGALACATNWMVLKGLGPTKLCTLTIFVLQFTHYCAGLWAVYTTEYQVSSIFLSSIQGRTGFAIK